MTKTFTSRTLLISLFIILIWSPLSASADELCASWSEALATYEAKHGPIPTDYAHIKDLDRHLQRIALAKLTPEQRAEVWKENLLEVRDQNPDFDQQQKRMIEILHDSLTPELFEQPLSENPALDRRIQELELAAHTLFTYEQVKAIMFRLGDSPSEEELIERLAKIEQSESGLEKTEHYCNCNAAYGYEDCEGGWLCVEDADDCWEVGSTCGAFGTRMCDGLCCYKGIYPPC